MSHGSRWTMVVFLMVFSTFSAACGGDDDSSKSSVEVTSDDASDDTVGIDDDVFGDDDADDSIADDAENDDDSGADDSTDDEDLDDSVTDDTAADDTVNDDTADDDQADDDSYFPSNCADPGESLLPDEVSVRGVNLEVVDGGITETSISGYGGHRADIAFEVGGFLNDYTIDQDMASYRLLAWPAISPRIATGSDGSRHVVYQEGQYGPLVYLTDQSGIWTRRGIDCDGGSFAFDIAIDDQDNPRVAYSVFDNANRPDALYNARLGDAGWEMQLVANDKFNEVSIGVGPGNVESIATTRETGLFYPVETVKVFIRNSGQWFENFIEQGYNILFLLTQFTKSYHSLEILVDSAAETHFLYARDIETYYYSMYGGGWGTVDTDAAFINDVIPNPTPAIVRSWSGRISSVSADIDSQDRIHSAFPSLAGTLLHAVDDGGIWTTEEIATSGGSNSDLDIDLTDAVHISHYDQDDGALLYTKSSQDGWETSIMRKWADLYDDLEIVTGLNGSPRIFYHRDDLKKVVVADLSAGTWQFNEILPLETPSIVRIHAASDSIGATHVVLKVDDGSLWYLHEANSNWSSETINLGPSSDLVLAVDPQLRPHLFYLKWGQDGKLPYHAVRDEAGGWIEESVPVPEPSTQYADSISMTIDNSGFIHASFGLIESYEWTGFGYATNSSGIWSAETIRNVSMNESRGTGIAVGLDGTVNIVASVVGDNVTDLNQLIYLHNENGAWIADTIAQDQGEAYFGLNPKLVIDENGGLHTISRHVPDNRLVYLTNSSGAWTMAHPEPDSVIGEWEAFALGSDQNVYVTELVNKSVQLLTFPRGYTDPI